MTRNTKLQTHHAQKVKITKNKHDADDSRDQTVKIKIESENDEIEITAFNTDEKELSLEVVE